MGATEGSRVSVAVGWVGEGGEGQGKGKEQGALGASGEGRGVGSMMPHMTHTGKDTGRRNGKVGI